MLARTRIAQGRAANALPDLNRIAPDFAAVFGPDHRQTLALLATHAQALLQMERYPEAIADESALYRLAVAGEGARSYFALGSRGDAARC